MELLIQKIFLFLHIIGSVLGAGGAFASDIAFFKSFHDKKITDDELGILEILSKMVWGGIVLILISGAGLFALSFERLATSGPFWAKMTLVGVVVVNGIFFHVLHLPYMGSRRNKHLFDLKYKREQSWLVVSGAISVVSWVGVLLIATALKYFGLSYWELMLGYAITLWCAFVGGWLVMRHHIHESEKNALRNALIITTLAVVFMGLIVLGQYARSSVSEETAITTIEDVPIYTREEVAQHATPQDCWVIVDDKVFDMTPAMVHAGSFNCGNDVSENYHKNHGPVIRPQMMMFFIGNLEGGSVSIQSDQTQTQREFTELNPSTDFFSNAGYDPHHLLFVVERDNGSLLVIDGATNKRVARIKGIGFQPHGVVYSSDAKFAYAISRDGWVTRISLETLQVLNSNRIGKSSRGIALTDNDRYVALGNYDPATAVIVDTTTLETVKVIDLTNETGIPSRAGALIERGNAIIIALKDANAVWVVDTDNLNGQIQKYWNIAGTQSTLHDAFLTPNGRYYIVAAQEADVVWILDTHTWEPVTTVKTGKKPHTGPGAYYNNTVYIPALGEGLITAIDMTTWTPKAYIQTSGPGLFARSYAKNPEYPYIWADTAFDEYADEIYVIDARSNEIVKTIISDPGKQSIHPEFSFDGKYVYVGIMGGTAVYVYDAYTFEEVTTIEAFSPSGIFNVGTRIEEPGL